MTAMTRDDGDPYCCAGLDATSLLVGDPNRTRLGNMGVTSNDILSRAETSGTALFFCISTRSSQGSSRIRLPRGKAGNCARFLISSGGAVVMAVE